MAVGLPQVYDWRQYKTDDGGSTPHVQSVEARLASLLNARGQVPSPCGEPQQDPSTSDSVEHDNSLANTLVGWTHARRYACAYTCICGTAVETWTLGSSLQLTDVAHLKNEAITSGSHDATEFQC